MRRSHKVSSNAKLFSSSATKFGSEPNSQVSLIDAAMPGMLPVINEFHVVSNIATNNGGKKRFMVKYCNTLVNNLLPLG